MSRDLHKRRKVTDIAAIRTPLPEPVAPPLHLAAPANAPLTAAPAAPTQETVAPPEAAPLAYDFGSMRVFPDQHTGAPTPPAAPSAPPSGPDQGTGTATPAWLSFPIQASLRINPPDDAYEQEAEQVARAVTHDSDGPGALEGAPDIASLYVQRSSTAPGLSVSPSVEANIARMQSGGGQPLPAADQSFFGQRFGHDFSQIRIHNDTTAAETSRSINARAFTVGNHIAFDAGEYQPGTASGRHLLAHELTHTIQQTGGVATKRADKPRAGHHFGAIQLYPSTLAVQREPAADEGVCPVCGKVGAGSCPGCGQPFLPVQRSLRPGADPLVIQRKAGPDLDLEEELRRALEQRGGAPQQAAGAAQGDRPAQNGAGSADSAAVPQSASEAMQALREGKLPPASAPTGDAEQAAGAGAPAGAASAAAGLVEGAASATAAAAVQGAQAAGPAALAQPAAQPAEAVQAAQSIADAAAQPADAAAQPVAEAPAAPAAEGAQALPETQPAQADQGAATTAAQNAAALLDKAAADTPLPEAQPEVAPPPSAEPVDAAGLPLPGDPETEAQIADLAGQVQQLREQGENLRAQAAEQRDNAGILRGNAQLIQSNIAASESGTTTAEGHLTARRGALAQARQALTASEKKAETVATKGQDGVKRSGDERKRSEPMATKSRDLAAENRANTPDDAEAAQNAREQGNKLNQAGSDSEQIDDTLGQAQEASGQLVQDAAQATQVNSQTSGKIDTVESTLEQTDKRIGEMQQQSTDARGQIEALSDGPETVQSTADALDQQGQALIQQSVGLEARLHEAQGSYLDGMRQVPAPVAPTPENTPPEQLAALATEAGEDPALYGLGADEAGLEDAGFGAEEEAAGLEDLAADEEAEAFVDEEGGEEAEAFAVEDLSPEDSMVLAALIAEGGETELGDEADAEGEPLLVSRKVADPAAESQPAVQKTAPVEEPQGVKQAVSEKNDKPIDFSENIPGWLIDAPPVNEQDRLAAQQQEEQRRKNALNFIGQESTQGFDNLSANEKRMIALKMTASNLFGGMDKISWPSMGDIGKGAVSMAVSMIDPRTSLKGVLDGMSMIANGVVNFAKEPSWGGALKMAADVATGLTIILGSITALAGVIIAIMAALSIVTLGLAAPVAGPVIAFCATVMTTVGGWTFWTGLIAAGLQALVFLKDLYMAGTAKTADELLNHSDAMTNDAKQAGTALMQAGTGKMSQVGGKQLKSQISGAGGGTKFAAQMGAKSPIGKTVAGIRNQGAGNFARSTMRSAGQRIAALPGQAMRGMGTMGKGMMKTARSLPGRIKSGVGNVTKRITKGAGELPGRTVKSLRDLPAKTLKSLRETPGRVMKNVTDASGRTLKSLREMPKNLRNAPKRLKQHFSESWDVVKQETDDIFGWGGKGSGKGAKQPPAPKRGDIADIDDVAPDNGPKRDASVSQSGKVESRDLSQKQIQNELDYINDNPHLIEGKAPNRRVRIGDHTWEENPAGGWCRHSKDEICVTKLSKNTSGADHSKVPASDEANGSALETDGLNNKSDTSSIVSELGKSGDDKIILKSNSVVIDTQTAIALEKKALGKELQEGEKAMIKRVSEMGDVDLVMSEQATKEFANKPLEWNGKPVRKGMAMKIDPDDSEYRSLLEKLENNNVGQGKGKGDRQIVAETFFAPTESGVTPTLVTHDPGIYNKLWKISSGKEPHPRHFGGKSLAEAFADGFDVTINGRTIRVIPIPKK